MREDGLHLIDAEMVAIDLLDEIELTSAPDLAVTVEVTTADDGDPLDVGAQEHNLVHRALLVLGASAAATVRKRIPAGAGLGGGSADAAAVLRWAGWTGTPDELVRAAELGADVAFCLVGGRARVTGIGEIVDPLPFESRSSSRWCCRRSAARRRPSTEPGMIWAGRRPTGRTTSNRPHWS